MEDKMCEIGSEEGMHEIDFEKITIKFDQSVNSLACTCAWNSPSANQADTN